MRSRFRVKYILHKQIVRYLVGFKNGKHIFLLHQKNETRLGNELGNPLRLSQNIYIFKEREPRGD